MFQCYQVVKEIPFRVLLWVRVVSLVASYVTQLMTVVTGVMSLDVEVKYI